MRIALISVLLCVSCAAQYSPVQPKAPRSMTALSSGEIARRPVGEVKPLRLAPELGAACRIRSPAGAAELDFDATELSSAERALLDQLALCLVSGPLVGRTLAIRALRADPIRRYLIRAGVDETKLQIAPSEMNGRHASDIEFAE